MDPISETKKRKRDTIEGGELHSDKNSKDTVKVELVDGEDEWCPVLASSPGVALPHNLSLQSYKKKTGGSVLKDPRIVPAGYKPEPVSYELLLYSSSHPRLDFVGKEERTKQNSATDNHLKHYVGVYDPQTSTVQVIPSRKVTVRRVPRVEAIEMRAAAAAAARQRTTLSAQRQELGLEFGSKRAKKVISANAQNAITSNQATAAGAAPEKLDAVGSALLSDAAAATKDRPDQTAMQAEVDAAKPRPKANLKADKPADVYSIDDLIGTDAMKALNVREWMETVEKGMAVHCSSKYVANRLRQFASGTGKDIQKLKILKYIATLLDFSASLKPGKRGTKALPKTSELKEKLKTSEVVVSQIERAFSDGGIVGKWHNDYLCIHVCALALTVDNFQVTSSDLKLDLKLDDNALTQYFRELGCRVRSPTDAERIHMKLSKNAMGGMKVAVLKMPLDFPVQRPTKRGRR